MYIDPGTLSLAIAAIAGAVLWLPYYFRKQIWGRFKAWLSARKRAVSGIPPDKS